MPPRSHPTLVLNLTLLVGTLGLLVGCNSTPRIGGEYLMVEGTALGEIAEELATLQGTRIGRVADELLAELPDCSTFSRHCPDGRCPEQEPLRCEVAPALSPLATDEDPWAIHYRRPLSDHHWVEVRAARAPGGATRGEVSLPVRALGMPGLAPAGAAPAPSVSSAHGRFLHLMLRPEGGLDIASALPSDGWGARLFALQSALFSATTLEGSLEVAMYTPGEDQAMPPWILAVPILDSERAVAAMEQFLAEIRAKWPVEVHPIEDARGVCLTNLNLLPNLSPCYIATPQHLVLGWNFESLLAAAQTPPSPDLLAATSHLEIDFEALGKADVAIARATQASLETPSYPWSAARVAAVTNDGILTLRWETLPRTIDAPNEATP